jgi:hypothetical protein
MGSAKLTRSQTAAVLKMTEDEVKKRDGRELHPQRGRDGSWLYEVTEVTALLTAAVTVAGNVEQGAITAAAFELFEQNVPLQRVAIQLKRSAPTILSLRKEYDSLAGTVSFSREHRDRLMSILGAPTHDPEVVVARVAALAARVRGAGARDHRDDEGDEDLGEVVDLATGERRGISQQSADEAIAALRARWRQDAGARGEDAQPREESQPSSSTLEAK